jgi:hypothetical protein
VGDLVLIEADPAPDWRFMKEKRIAVLFQGVDDLWRWHIVSGKGRKVIAQSPESDDREQALKRLTRSGIEYDKLEMVH